MTDNRFDYEDIAESYHTNPEHHIVGFQEDDFIERDHLGPRQDNIWFGNFLEYDSIFQNKPAPWRLPRTK